MFNFLSFAPVFLKELRQIWHSKLLLRMLFLCLVANVICLFLSFIPVASFLVNSVNSLIKGIVLLCSTISSLTILSNAASRWQIERGDPAIDIVLTSPISPWRIAIEKTLATALSSFLMVLIVFPVSCITLFKEQKYESIYDALTLLPISLLTLLAVVPVVLSSCSSISSKSRIKRNGLTGIVLLSTYFVFSGLFALLKQRNVENYIFIFSVISICVWLIGTSLIISLLSPQKSDRNLLSHLSLLLGPLVTCFIITLLNNNVQTKIIMPYTLGLVCVVFTIASLVERSTPSIRQIENCKSNPYLIIASLIFSSGALQCLILSIIALVIACTFGNWNLQEYNFLLKVIAYLTIYSFIANVIHLLNEDFSRAKLFVWVCGITAFLGVLGLIYNNGYLLSLIPWDGVSVKLTFENLVYIYIFVMLGNLYCYKNTIIKYLVKKDLSSHE